jgi:exopolysaccharide biosynthesis protein
MLVTRLSSRYALAGRPDAMDFDDGGSTAMTVGTRVVNRPSDLGGERAVSDGLFVGGQTP